MTRISLKGRVVRSGEAQTSQGQQQGIGLMVTPPVAGAVIVDVLLEDGSIYPVRLAPDVAMSIGTGTPVSLTVELGLASQPDSNGGQQTGGAGDSIS